MSNRNKLGRPVTALWAVKQAMKHPMRFNSGVELLGYIHSISAPTIRRTK